MNYLFALVAFSLFISCTASKDHAKDDLKNVTPVEIQSQPTEMTNDTLNPNAPLETQILGAWEWTKTICCGRTAHTETAESQKAPKVLNFQSDGTLQYFSGGEKTAEQAYKITYGIGHDDQRPLITIGAKQPALLFISGDSMVIDYGYFDLQTEFYQRQVK